MCLHQCSLVLSASVWAALPVNEPKDKKKTSWQNVTENGSEEVKTWHQERRTERKERRGHGSAHGEGKMKGGAALWGQGATERRRERPWLCFGTTDVPFLIPPVRGFVPWPSRKWELGRQQLTKELWRIQLAINGQPQAFVPVTMETAQHHYTEITKAFLHFSFSLHLPFSLLPFHFLLVFLFQTNVSFFLFFIVIFLFLTHSRVQVHATCRVQACWVTDSLQIKQTPAPVAEGSPHQHLLTHSCCL